MVAIHSSSSNNCWVLWFGLLQAERNIAIMTWVKNNSPKSLWFLVQTNSDCYQLMLLQVLSITVDSSATQTWLWIQTYTGTMCLICDNGLVDLFWQWEVHLACGEKLASSSLPNLLKMTLDCLQLMDVATRSVVLSCSLHTSPVFLCIFFPDLQ